MTKKILYVLLIVVMLLGIAGCSVDEPADVAVPEEETSEEEVEGEEEAEPAAKSDIVAVSLGWQENESGQRFTEGYEGGFEELGWEAVFSNANYDPKLQSEQIDAFIEMNPKALFLTCSDPVGITQAVQRAIDADIPVFTADCYIAGAAAITQIASNQYGMGTYSMEYVMNAIGGEGKIGIVGLPNNETWILRELGANYILRNYPNVETVYWPYDPTGAVTPRQAIENMLTANPELKAVWCAWDGAAMEGALAAQEAGRDDIILTGIDGGERAFEQIQAGGPFKLTMAQSIYWMSYMDTVYANDFLNGEPAPRFVVAPVFAVTKDVLDAVPEDVNVANYDIPGMELELDWSPVR